MSSRKYRVHANEGFVSDLMDYKKATRYAGRLFLLGNVNVQVKHEKKRHRSIEQRQNDLNALLDALIDSIESKSEAV